MRRKEDPYPGYSLRPRRALAEWEEKRAVLAGSAVFLELGVIGGKLVEGGGLRVMRGRRLRWLPGCETDGAFFLDEVFLIVVLRNGRLVVVRGSGSTAGTGGRSGGCPAVGTIVPHDAGAGGNPGSGATVKSADGFAGGIADCAANR